MREIGDTAMPEALKQIPTETLIALLQTRSLTEQDVEALQSLRPADKISSSETIIATGGSEEIKLSAEEFAKAIVRRNVHGKLPAGSKINGVEISRSDAEGFYDHGPDRLRISPLENKILYLHQRIYSSQREFPDLVNSHILSVVPSIADPKNEVLSIHFFQDREQVDSRGFFTPAHVSTEFPRVVMTKFLQVILKEPDLLDDFYKRSFVGLDGEGSQPGMRRVKADGFFLVSEAKIEEAGKVEGKGYRGVRTFFDALEKHLYQKVPRE